MLSVVVNWSVEHADLAATLADLSPQVEAVGGEIIVVSRFDGKKTRSYARFQRVDHPGEPAAWEAGARVARNMLVAFTAAGCRYAEGWARGAIEGASEVVAGPVGIVDGAGVVARCVYLCDYSAFGVRRIPAGVAAACNVSFDRATLRRLGPRHGWEKWAMLGRGGPRVAWSASMRAMVDPPPGLRRNGLAQFARGRHYAAGRSAGWARWARIAASPACVGLPAVRLGRLVADGALGRADGGSRALRLALMAGLVGCWSLGEMAGYLIGPDIDESRHEG